MTSRREAPHGDEANFARNMRRIREELSWSQADLVKELEDLGLVLHRQTIQKIEAGSRLVKLSEAKAIAQAFGVNLEDMTLDSWATHYYSLFWQAVDAEKKAVEALQRLYELQDRLARILDVSAEVMGSDDAEDNALDQTDADLIAVTHRDVHAKAAENFKRDPLLDEKAFEGLPEGLRVYRKQLQPESFGDYRRIFNEAHPDLPQDYVPGNEPR